MAMSADDESESFVVLGLPGVLEGLDRFEEEELHLAKARIRYPTTA